jgi:hypothetical protein
MMNIKTLCFFIPILLLTFLLGYVAHTQPHPDDVIQQSKPQMAWETNINACPKGLAQPDATLDLSYFTVVLDVIEEWDKDTNKHATYIVKLIDPASKETVAAFATQNRIRNAPEVYRGKSNGEGVINTHNDKKIQFHFSHEWRKVKDLIERMENNPPMAAPKLEALKQELQTLQQKYPRK